MLLLTSNFILVESFIIGNHTTSSYFISSSWIQRLTIFQSFQKYIYKNLEYIIADLFYCYLNIYLFPNEMDWNFVYLLTICVFELLCLCRLHHAFFISCYNLTSEFVVEKHFGDYQYINQHFKCVSHIRMS